MLDADAGSQQLQRRLQPGLVLVDQLVLPDLLNCSQENSFRKQNLSLSLSFSYILCSKHTRSRSMIRSESCILTIQIGELLKRLNLFALDGVFEGRVDDVLGGDDLPLGDDLLHLRQERHHQRMRLHLLRYLKHDQSNLAIPYMPSDCCQVPSPEIQQEQKQRERIHVKPCTSARRGRRRPRRLGPCGAAAAQPRRPSTPRTGTGSCLCTPPALKKVYLII